MRFAFLFTTACAIAWGVSAQTQTSAGDQTDLVKQGWDLNMQGKQREAIANFDKAIRAQPKSFEAHLSKGEVLDLMGKYAGARSEIRQALKYAPDAKSKGQAEKAMAISFAFERKPGEAARYEEELFNAQVAAGDFTAAGETADELARIYLECGDVNHAFDWYQKGYETAVKKADLSAAEKSLWAFRSEAAQARVAARRGNTEIADKDLAAAETFVAHTNNPQQNAFIPYLKGYLAFYRGDTGAAITDLQQANQHDPFVLSLLAQAYEKSGDKAKATETCQTILTLNMHNIANAFARPFAKGKLGSP
jgi:tetratricopeptide (TPR) repeat protein